MVRMARPRVIIASTTDDEHTRHVGNVLARRAIPFVVFDTGRFPEQLAFAFDPADLPRVRACRTGLEHIDFEAVRSIWWRRPRPPTVGEEVTDPFVRAFSTRESDQAMMGFWLALEGILWVNAPSKDRDAHMKPYQLALARRLGLATPRTLVTNDPDAASAFIEEIGLERIVYKVLVSDPVCWRETRQLRSEELAHLVGLRRAPAIFQEYIAGRLDIRATVVGSRIFAAAIDATATSYPQDYRMDLANAEIQTHQMPDQVSDLLIRLCRELGLAYAAADFRVAPDGEYVFLELNPAGQWLFIEHSTGLPIGAAMADLLTSPA